MFTVQPPLDADSERPNLDWYRKRAKTLFKEFRSGLPEAQQRFSVNQSPITQPSSAKLSDAQFVVARESGFASWTRLKRHVESIVGTAPPRLRPYVRDIDWYRDRAEGFLRSFKGQMHGVHDLIRQYLPNFAVMSDVELSMASFSLEDALHIQARQHGFDSWELFVKHIDSLNSGDEREPFLLAFEALQSGDIKAFSGLLKSDPGLVHARGSNGNSLLNLAASFRRVEACRMLLDTGASVDVGNNYGWTPLHQAAMMGNVPLAKMFVAAGGSLKLSARGEGGTPLVQALFWGKVKIADFLARHDISPRNLRVAAGLGRLDLLEACFDSKGDLTSEAKASREFYRPHGEFPEWSPSDDAQEILDEAFTYACRSGRIGVLELLMECGANISGEPYRGTGLIWASHQEQFKTVRWLVAHGANINQQATFGGRNHGVGVTALHMAAQDGSMEKLRLLIELGADPAIPDHLFDATAIDWAKFCGSGAAAEYLLALPQAGILNLATNGLTERVAQVLERNPELVNGVSGENRALPLHRSVANGYLETARLLLGKGANPNLLLRSGKSALSFAIEGENEAMVQLLKGFGAELAGRRT